MFQEIKKKILEEKACFTDEFCFSFIKIHENSSALCSPYLDTNKKGKKVHSLFQRNTYNVLMFQRSLLSTLFLEQYSHEN